MSADANNSQERAILMLLPVIVGPFQIAICLWAIAMTIGWAMAFCLHHSPYCHADKHQYLQKRSQMDPGGYKACRQKGKIGQ